MQGRGKAQAPQRRAEEQAQGQARVPQGAEEQEMEQPVGQEYAR